MRKKLIVLLIVAAIAVSSAVATPLLQIGPMVAYNNGIININDDINNEELSIHSFTFGADIRLNLFNWVSIDVPATYGYANPGIHTIGLLPSLNLNIPAVSWLDIAVGVGLHMDFEYDQGSKNWYINGYDMGQFEKAIYGASLDYRLVLRNSALCPSGKRQGFRFQCFSTSSDIPGLATCQAFFNASVSFMPRNESGFDDANDSIVSSSNGDDSNIE